MVMALATVGVGIALTAWALRGPVPERRLRRLPPPSCAARADVARVADRPEDARREAVPG